MCSPCGHNSVATCLHYCGNCLTIFIRTKKGTSITVPTCVHIAIDNITVLLAVEESSTTAAITVSSHFSLKSALGKLLKSIKVLKASQFIPVPVISFRGAVLVDLLKRVFLCLHTVRQQSKSKSFSSLTPQEETSRLLLLQLLSYTHFFTFLTIL